MAAKKKASKAKPKVAKTTHTMPDGSQAKLLTDAVWQQVAEFYAQHGPDHSSAATRFGYARRTMVRLYYEGSKSLEKPPINTMMEDVELKARAIRNQLQEENIREAEAEMAKLMEDMPDKEAGNSLVDAAQARAHEGMMVSAGRRNITMFKLLAGGVLEAMAKRLPDMMKMLEEELTPRQLVAMLKDLSRGLADAETASKANMEQERLLMGQPTALIGVSSANMDKDKAMQVMALANKTYLRLQREAPDPIAAKIAAAGPELPVAAGDDVYEDANGPAEEDAAQDSATEAGYAGHAGPLSAGPNRLEDDDQELADGCGTDD